MDLNQLTGLLTVVFWLVVLIYLVVGPVRRLRREWKQRAVLDQALSRLELTQQRLAHATARRSSLNCPEVLGVRDDASPAELKRAWSRKVR